MADRLRVGQFFYFLENRKLMFNAGMK